MGLLAGGIGLVGDVKVWRCDWWFRVWATWKNKGGHRQMRSESAPIAALGMIDGFGGEPPMRSCCSIKVLLLKPKSRRV